MFTGLVESIGRVVSLERKGESASMYVETETLAAEASLGESIAVNGCCLTVAGLEGGRIRFDLLAETLRRTNLGEAEGRKVNLERALAASARLGGHFVQGHIDGTAEILAIRPEGADFCLEISLPVEAAAYFIPKGSIAVDGISLTVADLQQTRFTCWIIPHTMAMTNLSDKRAGERVNLEYDVLAKYVERILLHRGTGRESVGA